MTDEERAKKLQEFTTKIGEHFSKEGEASGLASTDGILALMNFAADATVQIAAQCEKPSDFIGWAIQTYFQSLKFFADGSEIDVGLVVKRADEDDNEPEPGGGMVH